MKKTKYKQGVFKPTNRDKCKTTSPFFRSSWEFLLMTYLDRSPNILEWKSEGQIVYYADVTRRTPMGQPTVHRYFIDFQAIAIDKNGKRVSLWIEVKPESQSHPPVKGRKSDKTFLNESITYARNRAKWNAAEAAAKQRGARFIVLTEKSLG
jgi:hypothetical protein